MIPPRENLFFWAGILAGLFVLYAVIVPDADADSHAAQQARAELRRDAAAAKACPPGHAALWIDPTTMTCNKEIKQ